MSLISKDRSRAYCVRSSCIWPWQVQWKLKLLRKPKVCPRLSPCDRKPVIDLQMPASRNNRISTSFQRLMRGHGAAKTRHTYTLVCMAYYSTATFICGGYATPDYIQVHIFIRVQFVQGTRTSRSGPGLNVCWLIKDRLRRG